MSYRIDISRTTEALAGQGNRVLITAILAEIEEARTSIANGRAIRQADKMLATLRDYLALKATKDDCLQQRTALTASTEFNRAQRNVETPYALYRFQLACAELAQIAINDTAFSSAWVAEDLVEFWHAWTKQPKIQARRDILAHLQAYLQGCLRAAERLEMISGLPSEAIEARSRLSTLASRAYSLC